MKTKIFFAIFSSLPRSLAEGKKKCSFDDDEKMLNGYVFELVGEQYKMWRDDNYIYQFVCEKYGFVLKNNLS